MKTIAFMFRAILYSALLCLPGIVLASGIQLDPEVLLKKMTQAEQQVSYQGTFVYIRGEHIDTIRVDHKAGKAGQIQEILHSLSGQKQKVVRTWSQDSKPQNLDTGFRLPLKLPIDALRKVYRFIYLGQGRIAGRAAWLLSIQPRDQLRYGYRLWLDKETGLLLKSVLRNEDQDILEQYMFTHLDNVSVATIVIKTTSKPPEKILSPSAQLSGDVTSPVTSLSKPSSWSFKYLPEGFRLLKEGVQQKQGGNQVNHLLLSDGLASVSVFIEDIQKKKKSVQGFTKMGAMCIAGNVIDGHQIAVIGEVPVNTIKKILQSIARRDP